MGHPESRKLSWGALVLLWLLQEEAVASSLPERKGAGADLQLGSPLGLSAIAGFIIFVWPVHYRTSAWNRRDGQLSDDSTSAKYFNRDAFEDYLEITVDKDSSNLPADEYIATGPCTYIVGWIQGPGAIIGEHSQIGERKTRETTAENKRTQISQDFSGRSLTIDTLTDNETQIVEDNHSYYLSRIYGPQENRAKELWVEVAEANRSQVKIHGILSNTHRQASRIILSFDFPFYGHYLRQVTIATGGFIFMGDVIHRMLTATQYIAPLMANFNPGYSRNSTVKYFDNGTMFVVQWDQVYLEGKEDKGCFVFQAALYNSGRIVFGYKEIPMSVLEISSTQHPVKAGLSDAFMILNSSPESQHRTIYEYHRVELDTSKITSASAVEFLPLPTCLQLHNCEACMTSGLNFNCSWCHVLQRCSSGFDRYHEEWLEYGCGQESEEKTCADFEEDEHYMSSTPNHSAFTPLPEDTITSSSQFIDSLTTEDDTKLNQNPGEEVLRDHVPTKKGGTQIHTGTIVGILLAVLLIAAIILAGIYITSNPTSSAALFFIERRPHQWPTMKFRNRSPYTEVEPSGQEKDSFVEADQC